MPTNVPCPTCSRLVDWSPDSPFRPFCSERCKLIDLGEWFSEDYRIPDPADTLDEDALHAESNPLI
jgi:uncharacterized protein